MQDFRRIVVWQKSHAMALDVYAVTTRFPEHERWVLTSQMRRAAVSTAANIVEGRFRGGDREFARSLRVALGSAAELEYYVLLASDLSFLQEADRLRLVDAVVEVKRMLTALIQKLKTERIRHKATVPSQVGPVRNS
jgi:four helix bundle protein